MDLRMPVGVLFVILGVMLAGYGLVSGDRAEAHLGFNVNLWWGAGMLLFGSLMVLAARMGARRTNRTTTRGIKRTSAGGPN